MQYRIRRFGIHATARTVAIMYFGLSFVLVPLIYVVSHAGSGAGFPSFVYVLLPFFYAVIGYVSSAIACWLYNIVAGWTGGASLALEPDGAA